MVNKQSIEFKMIQCFNHSFTALKSGWVSPTILPRAHTSGMTVISWNGMRGKVENREIPQSIPALELASMKTNGDQKSARQLRAMSVRPVPSSQLTPPVGCDLQFFCLLKIIPVCEIRSV